MQPRSDKNIGEVIIGRIDQIHDDPQCYRNEQHKSASHKQRMTQTVQSKRRDNDKSERCAALMSQDQSRHRN